MNSEQGTRGRSGEYRHGKAALVWAAEVAGWRAGVASGGVPREAFEPMDDLVRVYQENSVVRPSYRLNAILPQDCPQRPPGPETKILAAGFSTLPALGIIAIERGGGGSGHVHNNHFPHRASMIFFQSSNTLSVRRSLI